MTGTINITGSGTLITTILSNFSIPTKTVEDSPFQITAPTTNSNGVFSYTSSNTSVATIYETTIIIVGDGTSTITATQAATSTHTSGTTSTTLVVNTETTTTSETLVEITATATTTLSNFSIPTKSYLDSPFQITAPTTNSNGAFSYVSSNPSVATITNNNGIGTITIVDSGTSTIIATQAATSTHTSKTITATLTVNKLLVCLTNPSIVNVISGNYVFNNSTKYHTNIQYGLGIGTYVFKNISSSHPIALLNNGKTMSITYSGDRAKKLTKLVGFGVYYDFYYGDVTVEVSGDFGTISVYCYYNGYMGGHDLLKYSASCYIAPPPSLPYPARISMRDMLRAAAQAAALEASRLKGCAHIFYKSHSLSSGGGGNGVRNSRHKQRRT
jgi:hypothetical protein